MKIRFPYTSGTKDFEGFYEDVWEGVVARVQRRYAETQLRQRPFAARGVHVDAAVPRVPRLAGCGRRPAP
jgi:hypothetical protein